MRLHLAELTLHGPTLRDFDIGAEGLPLAQDLDLAAQLGIQYGGVLAARVTVSDGRLDIEASGVDPSLLSAIEVWTAPGSPSMPAAVVGLAATGSYARNVVTWTPSVSPTVTGYRVYRADTPNGAYDLLGTTWAAPGRWLDDDVVAGQPRSYRVTAVNSVGVEGPTGATATATPLSAATSTLPVTTLDIAPEDLALLDAAVLIDTELTVPAVVGFQGNTWNVQVRYRGATSLT